MIWAFLSSRVRTWMLFALVLPLVGRVLSALGGRMGDTRPRAGRALTRTGDRLGDLRGKKRRRGAGPVRGPH
jgi:hypothetical protein